jgi:RimJ/RimL family protein N-acetyltransferase
MSDQRSVFIEPIILEGRWVRLEPLREDHAAALGGISLDPEIWRYMPSCPESQADIEDWVRAALSNRARGNEMPFVQIERETGVVIGSTRLLDIRPDHRGVEIGFTWLARPWWWTRINSEAKYLLLRYLFEDVGCIRVALKTDLLNERSQQAIERLGAKCEGVLRRHMIVQGGRYRDTVYYSVLDDEWPGIKERMERELYGALSDEP